MSELKVVRAWGGRTFGNSDRHAHPQKRNQSVLHAFTASLITRRSTSIVCNISQNTRQTRHTVVCGTFRDVHTRPPTPISRTTTTKPMQSLVDKSHNCETHPKRVDVVPGAHTSRKVGIAWVSENGTVVGPVNMGEQWRSDVA